MTTNLCAAQLPACAAQFARLEERIDAAGKLRHHIDAERDRERDSLAESIERLDESIARLANVATRLEDHEKRLVAVEDAVRANTEQRVTLATWLTTFRTFGPYAWTAIIIGGGALIAATRWAIGHGLLAP